MLTVYPFARAIVTAVEAESDWFITARAFSSPLLCHNAKHFIRKERSVLLAVSFKALEF